MPLDNAITTIYEDRGGNLWIGTPTGLNLLDRSTGTFTHYRHDPEDQNTLSHNGVTSILEDASGNLWIGTGGGLNLLNRTSGTFTHIRHDPDNKLSLAHDGVISIIQDRTGFLWVGTADGLDRFDARTSTLDPGLSSNQMQFDHFQHDPDDPDSLSDNLVITLFQDLSGVLWVGTANGISKFNRRASQFAHYLMLTDDSVEFAMRSGLSDNKVLSVFEDRDNMLWIGTFNGGLDQLDTQSGDVLVFQSDPADPDSLSDNQVQALYQDSAGTLWAGTGNGWLEQFDPQARSFAHFRELDAPVLDITEDHSGNLWFGTEGEGLYRLNRETTTLTHYEQFWRQPDHWWRYGSLSSHIVTALYIDQFGVPWVGTRYGGINLWDQAEERFTHLRHDPDDPSSLGHDQVLAIFEDPDQFPGVVWVGTGGGGLNRFDRSTGTFTRYTKQDGLPSDNVTCILADDVGYLWLGTVNGLARFDPHTQTFRHYDERDGVGAIGSSFSPLSCLKRRSGAMVFGGIGGLLVFDPAQIEDNQHVPPVVITSLNNADQVIQRDLLAGEHFRFSHTDNFISFEFTALDYTVPEKNQYAYMMEGLDEGWVHAGTRRYASYPDLRPGDYLFRVKGSNNDGVWNEEGVSVRITVEPPFWQTWLFRIIAAITLILIILGIIRQREINIQAQSKKLERQVEQRTAELLQTNVLLEQEINERKRAEEALAHKAAEEAIVAERGRLARELHDAVTQTLFSASLIAEALPAIWEMNQQEGRELLMKLRGLSRGALSEMRTLLLELRPASLVEADIGDLLRQLASAFAGREGVPVEVTIQGEGELPTDVHITLYRIAQEALNNVIKHARAGQVNINLQRSLGKDGLVEAATLIIRDDGRGFDPADIAPDQLGISIMRERAQAIRAALDIASEPGRGTSLQVKWSAKEAERGEPHE